jgi:hypothetical protein
MITNLTIFVTLMQFGSMMQIAPIEGQVRDAQTRKALAMVRIELFQQRIPIATIFTGPDGRFRFPSVFAGDTISADSAEYEPKSIEVDSMMFWRIDVELNRKKDRPQAGSPFSVKDLGESHRRGLLRRLLSKFK